MSVDETKYELIPIVNAYMDNAMWHHESITWGIEIFDPHALSGPDSRCDLATAALPTRAMAAQWISRFYQK